MIALLAATALAAAAHAAPQGEAGIAAGRCRPGEPGPAFIVVPEGLKDGTGSLRLELYPGNEADFLGDDWTLVRAGKAFARVVMPTAALGRQGICIRIPAPGTYGLVLQHDRDGQRRFNWRVDGIGFSSNPKIGWSQPNVARVRVTAGGGLTPVRIVLNYRRGLGVAPLRPRGST